MSNPPPTIIRIEKPIPIAQPDQDLLSIFLVVVQQKQAIEQLQAQVAKLSEILVK